MPCHHRPISQMFSGLTTGYPESFENYMTFSWKIIIRFDHNFAHAPQQNCCYMQQTFSCYDMKFFYKIWMIPLYTVSEMIPSNL